MNYIMENKSKHIPSFFQVPTHFYVSEHKLVSEFMSKTKRKTSEKHFKSIF